MSLFVFSSFFFFLFLSWFLAPGQFILAVSASPPPRTPLPEIPSHTSRGAGDRWGGGKWRGTQQLTAHSLPAFPCYSWGTGWVSEGCWYSFPSPPVVKLCPPSIFQMIHWDSGKKGIKRTSLSFLSRIEGFSTEDSRHFWSSKMHSKKAK